MTKSKKLIREKESRLVEGDPEEEMLARISAKRAIRGKESPLPEIGIATQVALTRISRKRKTYENFEENYVRFLKIAETANPVNGGAPQTYTRLEAAEIVYKSLRVAEINNLNDSLIKDAMSVLRKDYRMMMDYFNRERGK